MLTNNSYCQTLLRKNVMNVVNVNRKGFEPYADKLDAALFQFSQNTEQETEQKNHEDHSDPDILFEESF